MILTITSLEKTWFRVIVDKRDTLEYLLYPGNEVDLQSTELFEFLIGNSRGIKINYNSEQYGPFGEAGQVVRYLRIDSSGVSKPILVRPRKILPENDNV